MNIIEKANNYRASVSDIGLIKFAVFAATLLIAKLWPAILGLDWYWYLIFCIAASIIPFYRFMKIF